MKIHVAAICGTAMASLAGLLRERGDTLTGSDQDVYPPMSTQLRELGIEIRTPYAEDNVPRDADLVVIGNALSRGNPEVEVVLDRGQPMTSGPALLGDAFVGAAGRRAFVVAGTHGKTTTTSLLAHALERAGRAPSFVIGGIANDFARSYQLGAGEEFVIEGDEYDCAFFDKRPKFVHYRPQVAILGNVEFDHADIYPDLASVKLAFTRLIDLIPRRGLLIAGVESPALRELLPRARCRVETFAIGGGGSDAADWRADDLRATAVGTSFRLSHRDARLGEFTVPMAGAHNVRNALAAIAAAHAAAVEPEALREPLRAFRGVKRRLELRGTPGGVFIYDDFAHHPTAVRATLDALREAMAAADSPGRLIAVFEPRSYTSRTRVFAGDFASALAAADRVFVAGAHLPGKVPPAERISEAELAAAVAAHGTPADFIAKVPDIVAALCAECRAGDSVAVLSNGGFGGLHEALLAALSARG